MNGDSKTPTSTVSASKVFRLIPETNFDFIGKRRFFYAVSAVILLAGIVSLVVKGGPKWALDFTGGNLVEVRFEKDPGIEAVRTSLNEDAIPSFELQSISGEGIYIIRTQIQRKTEQAAAVNPSEGKTSAEVSDKILAGLQKKFTDQKVSVLRSEYVGPTVGGHLIRQTFLAFVLTFLGIIVYVGFRFHSGVWGAAGVLSLVHDVAVVVGVFSIMNKEISVTIVAALLTLAGYSINDTIVIFDRMREKLRLLRTEPMKNVMNKSINETLSRTVITSLTVFFVVLTLYFFGGEVLHDFALALLIGVIAGSYSTVGVASAMIYDWDQYRSKGRR